MIYVTQCSAYATKRIKYPGINLPKETKEVTVSVHMCCPSLSLPPPIHSHPPRLLQSPSLSSLSHTPNPHWLSILHMVVCMFQSYSLHSSHPLLSPLCPQICSLCVHLLLLCEQIHQYHPSRFHIYVLICNICFPLSDLLYSV